MPEPIQNPDRLIATGSVEQVNRFVAALLQRHFRGGELTEEQQRTQIRYSVAIGLRVGEDASFDADKWDVLTSAALHEVAERGRLECETLSEVIRHVARGASWGAPFSQLGFEPSALSVLDLVENMLLQDAFVRTGPDRRPVLSERDELTLYTSVKMFLASTDPRVVETTEGILKAIGRQEGLAD